MNISKFPALCFLATVLAFAQEPVEQPPPPVVLEVAPVSSSSETALVSSSSETAVVVLPPASSSSSSSSAAVAESKTIFDSLRGHAYNPYSTVGAPTAIGDLITTPSDINGQKFFYVSPTDRLGYTAFDISSGTALLGLDSSPLGSPAALILGYANSAFGFALNYSVSKFWQSNDHDDVDMRYTDPGDNIGVYLSMPIGSAVFYANASWLTSYASEELYGSSVINYEGSETVNDCSEIEANIGLTDKLNSLSYDTYLSALRSGCTQIQPGGTKLVDTAAYLAFSLNFNIGSAVLQSSNARVIVGMNNRLYFMFYDKTKNIEGDYKIGYSMIPNILADISLFDNWLAFAGAAHAFRLIAGDGDRDSKTSELAIYHLPSTGAIAGIRYQRTNWAVEAQIAADIFKNPFGGFNGSNMFGGFGGFVYF